MTNEQSHSAPWPTYTDVSDLLDELELSSGDLEQAAQLIDDHIRAWHLAQVRAEQDKTQTELATAMGVTQPRVSALERGELDSVTLSTLRAYVRALGGNLRIVADFGDREFRLT